jgi:hypothetical protein
MHLPPAKEKSVSRKICHFPGHGKRRSELLWQFSPPGKEHIPRDTLLPRSRKRPYLGGYAVSPATEKGEACCYASFPPGKRAYPARYASSVATERTVSREIWLFLYIFSSNPRDMPVFPAGKTPYLAETRLPTTPFLPKQRASPFSVAREMAYLAGYALFPRQLFPRIPRDTFFNPLILKE